MIEAANLNKIPDVRHGFFTREGGFSSGHYGGLNCSYSSGDAAENVARNREHIATALGVEAPHLMVAQQYHSAEVVTVTTPWSRENTPKADGLVTAIPNIALGVTTADCGPVLFADQEGGVIGAAHAGWRGALGGVTDATIAAMEGLGARRERIFAALGPTISGPVYEVGSELREEFVTAASASEQYFSPSDREGHFLFDLPAYIKQRLFDAGIASVEILGTCTYSDKNRFFSFRRTTHRNEKIYGCQLSAITLGPDSFIREA